MKGILLCAIVGALISTFSRPTSALFEQSPKNTTAGLGFPAVFECVAQPGIVAMAWFIDGTSALTQEIADRNITPFSQPLPNGGIEGALTIPATETNNNTEIVCQIITISDRTNSTPAVLTIQGLLAAPGNPNVVNTNDRIPVVLRWDAPFSLVITNVDPDISNYTVFITNLNTSRNGSETVTETEFEFTNLPEEDPNPCYIYAFGVTAVNIVGEGNISEPVQGNIRGAPQAVPAERVDVTLTIDVQSGTWTISMECELASLDCPGAVPETFMVNTTNDDGSAGCVHTDMIAEPTSQGRLRISFTENVNTLIVNEVYGARVHAVNSVGNTPSTGFVRFTTFDLQTLTVHLNGTITCQYVTGSAAQGCLVIAREGDNVVYAIVRIQESTDSLRLEESGDSPSYTVMGFDLEQNGVFSTQPAVVVRDASMMGTLQQELDIRAVSMATATTGDDGLVCVSCTLVVGSDATGCVAILISLENTGSQQLLSQSIPQDQSGSSAQGCFPVFSLGNFLLAIFAVGSNGPLGSAPAHVATVTISEAVTTPPPGERNGNTAGVIAGTITAVVVLMISTVVVLCLCYQYHKRKGGKAKDQDTIEMKDNAAYEVHQLPHPRPQPAAVQLQPCAAYGVISSH